MQLLSRLAPAGPNALAAATLVVTLTAGTAALRRLLGKAGDQNVTCLISLLLRYRQVDFAGFMRKHREAFRRGQDTGDYVPGVCHYYSLMSDIITMTSGPFWHFVPMFPSLSRQDCHRRFHHTLTKFLEAAPGDKVLEIGCGFGEMGRQVSSISGASVTGLTMADVEVEEGARRIEAAGLKGKCDVVQGNYHETPFEAESFDKVFGVYTLKYSSDLQGAFREAARVLKPGGKLLSYEILVTDRYDPEEGLQRSYVERISSSTCMPPLWRARDFREAARKAGLEGAEEEDLCGPGSGACPWYSCFERTGIHALLSSGLLLRLIQTGEAIRLLPGGFSDWFETCAVHPATDFVNGGRLGVVSGAVVMTWRKPGAQAR